MDLDPLRQDITAVLEECYSRGMQLPFLFVAVSLDGKLIGVRFTAAEDSGCAYRWQPECACDHAHAHLDATGQAACALISCPRQVTFRYP